MSINRTLYLHIGNHKTGTTSIQKTLVQDKAYLESKGFTLFHSTPSGKLRKVGNLHAWMTRSLSDELPIREKEGFFEALGRGVGDVIVSDEGFSYLASRDNISHFVERFKQDFSEIKVIVYLRRQDDQVISHHQQGSKEKHSMAMQLYGTEARAIPNHNAKFDQYLNYFQRLSYWGDAVSDSNMLIRIFEKSRLLNGDVVDDFYGLLGLERKTYLDRENESKGFVQTKVGHLINSSNMSEQSSSTLRPYLDNQGKMLPGRKQAEAIYQHYKDSNRELNKRFKIHDGLSLFDESFEHLEYFPQDLWDEDKANLAVKNILLALQEKEDISREDMAFFVDCVGKVYFKDVDFGDELLALARRLSKKSDAIEIPTRDFFISQLGFLARVCIVIKDFAKGIRR